MNLKTIAAVALGILMIIPGAAHFVSPDVFNAFIPDGWPKLWINYLAGFIEISLGIGLCIPQYRGLSAKGVFWLMLAFLPLHILDVFLDNPAIGNKMLAWIRLPMQFVLMAWARYCSKT